MSVTALLDRLPRVKPTGPDRWVAGCPLHGKSGRPVSIRALDDGRILLWDFGGCETPQIMSAIGLPVSALFPANSDWRPEKDHIPARDLLEICDHEITVSCMILADILEHHAARDDQWQRLAEAAALIARCRDHLSPARVSGRG